MRVVLDWHAARTHAPGAGRYLRELTRGLAEVASAEDVLVRLDWGRNPRADLPPDAHGRAAALPLVRRPWPRRLAGWLDLFGCGPGGCAGGGWFHTARPDMACGSRGRLSLAIAELPADPRQLARLRSQAAAAEQVFVFTPLWRQRVAQALALPSERVQSVPVGCDHWLRALEGRPVRGSDVLVLGARTGDGGLLELASAVRLWRDAGWRGRLVCAGRPGSADDALRALDPRGDWVSLASPREAEMPAMVAAAGLLACLARDPGTPVTPLEGLALGTPVLCRRSAALEDVLGSSVQWFTDEDLRTPSSLATSLARTLAARPGAAEAALVARHTWRRSAQAHLAIWRASRPRT